MRKVGKFVKLVSLVFVVSCSDDIAENSGPDASPAAQSDASIADSGELRVDSGVCECIPRTELYIPFDVCQCRVAYAWGCRNNPETDFFSSCDGYVSECWTLAVDSETGCLRPVFEVPESWIMQQCSCGLPIGWDGGVSLDAN